MAQQPAYLKDYEGVSERIAKFYRDNPDGRIETMLLSDENNFDWVRYRARIFLDSDEQPDFAWSVGHASGPVGDERGAGYGERKVETAAVGRALHNAGYLSKSTDANGHDESQPAASKPASGGAQNGSTTPKRVRALANGANLLQDYSEASVAQLVHPVAESFDELDPDALGKLEAKLKGDIGAVKSELASKAE